MTAIQDLIDELEVSKVLVIAPLRVAKDTWSREARKWDHLGRLRISRVLGNRAERRRALLREADIYVINRENVAWLVNEGVWDFDMVVIDELSSFKSAGSGRFRALRKVICSCSRVVGLTGTPAANGYLDLWPEMYLIDSGQRLGKTLGFYKASYFKNVSRDRTFGIYQLLPKAKEIIDKKLSSVCMSMKAEDYLDMPERIMNYIPIELEESEKRIYDTMESEACLALSDTESIEAFNAAAVMNKLLQLANGFAYGADGAVYRIHEKKLDALEDILDANPNDPILVFYSYKADKEALLQRFPKARTLETAEDIEAWNAGKVPMIIAHPASIGHGLNIQEGGHIIVWYGLTWSLELYQQANARLYRQGQASKNVIINHLIAQGTVDEQVIRALETKNVTQESLMAALKERMR